MIARKSGNVGTAQKSGVAAAGDAYVSMGSSKCTNKNWAVGLTLVSCRHACLAAFSLLSLGTVDTAVAQRVAARIFADPPRGYRPTVSIDEGSGYAAPMDVAARRAIEELGAGGLMFNPQSDPSRKKLLDREAIRQTTIGLLDEYPPHASPWLPKALPGEARFGSYMADSKSGPGRPGSMGYLTPAWFSAVESVLDLARRNGLDATYYDEAGFPSGSANGTIPPRFHRKLLRKEETTVSVGQPFRLDWLPDQRPVAVVALDSASGTRLDLLGGSKVDSINWTAPLGNWRVQRYFITTAAARPLGPDYYGTADYLDVGASNWFIQNSYERAREGLADQFGATIQYTFFDDVGIFPDEKTWHPAVAERFERLTGKQATLYFPALWEDIGPETSAARVAFFKARAEILGETFPRLVTEWAHAHGVKSMGHAPGNYDLQPTDTIGDPFKFYAYTDVPTADVLWGLGFARGGYKLISSVSAQRDLPLTGAEMFSVTNDANGYRRTIELFVRGFNHFVFGARVPARPLGTPAELMRWAGRSSYLLQGGRHVADLAVIFPIESLQASYSFNAPQNTANMPWGTYAYRDADYQAVGEMLVSGLHRDFTFVHPDALASAALQVRGHFLERANEVNREQYRAVILPGGAVISVAALKKLKAFWDAGGTVIATSLLPSQSAEFGHDDEVRQLVADMFGDSAGEVGSVRLNDAGGQATFLRSPSVAALASTLSRLQLEPDVEFLQESSPTSGNGVFGYIHRVRDGKDIYYFGNSSDTPIDTPVELRGRLVRLESWDPHSGHIERIRDVEYRNGPNGPNTVFRLSVRPISSLAIVGIRSPQ